uniref:Uncharacterized protein n=1 Tax=Xiphophorus couchianus TaxID=32473 RepID=A0A3B5LE44_9TELE
MTHGPKRLFFTTVMWVLYIFLTRKAVCIYYQTNPTPSRAVFQNINLYIIELVLRDPKENQGCIKIIRFQPL